uniref:Mic1 domain-containing protein n=2 Tax=Physcomitrium patens TaxID=3218 RepID=A0A7I4E153_PHYPA
MGLAERASSSSGARLGMGAGGAKSHAYIQYPPLRCDIPGAAGVMYDDGNKLLLVPAPSKVYSWPTNQHPPAELPGVTDIKEGPILGVRYSLDGKILAIQRTNQEIEFVNKESCTGFKQQCRSGSDRIFGFFWTDCPACDIVFVTTSGLEMYTLYLSKNGLKLVEYKKTHVSWYVYTHESRLVLLASGMQCKTLSGYQFAAGGIVRLPKYDVTMTKQEYNRKPVLAPEDIRIATMYGRLYCVQVDRVALQLHMYRFYRDAVVPQGSLPIFSSHVAISVVDNVLLVHQTDSQVVLLYDILTDPRGPISAPLPLLLRGAPSPAASSSSNTGKGSRRPLSTAEATIYGKGWVFINPDLVLDHMHGLLWRVRLDLEAVAASSSNLPSLLSFLQRRRFDAPKAKELSLIVIKSMIIERRSLRLIASAMDVVTASYAQATRPSSGTGGSGYQPMNKSTAVSSGGITLSAGPRAGSQSSSNPVGKAMSKSKIVEIEQDAETVSDAESIISSEIEEAPLTSSQEQTSAPSSSRVLSREGSKGITMESSTSNSSSLLASGLQGLRMGLPAPYISPDDVLQSVFLAIEEEMCTDSTFYVAAIVEYMRSTAKENVRVPPGLQALMVQLLGRDERYHELRQFVAGKLIDPSRTVALQLLDVGTNDRETRKLGMEMLRLLHAHCDYVKLLLQDGRLLEGLRYIRQNKVDTIPPALFLEAAANSNDIEKLASVFRFCLDFLPGFQQTPDFNLYSSRLNQQCIVGSGC